MAGPLSSPPMLRTGTLLAACAVVLVLAGCRSTPDYGRPLPVDAPPLLPLGPDEPRPDLSRQWADRETILEALEHSVRWLSKPQSPAHFPAAGISHGRVAASCLRLADLLRTSPTGEAFDAAVAAEFEVFKSAGWNGRGDGVLFTAYYTPIFHGRLEQDDVFRWPLYAKPPDLRTAPSGEVLGMAVGDRLVPYPTRRTIDGRDLLVGRDLELVWLADPLDAYLCHVQGSAYVRLSDGELLRLGFGGTNGREYTSIAQELVEAGELRKDHTGMPAIRAWAKEHPERLERYLHENDRYTFFTPIETTPHGSLDVPVTPLRTLATDKRLFPRAAPVFVDAELSTGADGESRNFRELLFDQDTGGGIRTAGRADVYVGVGDQAGEVAGRTRSEGQLYYLFLRADLVPAHAP